MKFQKISKAEQTETLVLSQINFLADRFNELAAQASLFRQKGEKFTDAQKNKIDDSLVLIQKEMRKIEKIFLTKI